MDPFPYCCARVAPVTQEQQEKRSPWGLCLSRTDGHLNTAQWQMAFQLSGSCSRNNSLFITEEHYFFVQRKIRCEETCYLKKKTTLGKPKKKRSHGWCTLARSNYFLPGTCILQVSWFECLTTWAPCWCIQSFLADAAHISNSGGNQQPQRKKEKTELWERNKV